MTDATYTIWAYAIGMGLILAYGAYTLLRIRV